MPVLLETDVRGQAWASPPPFQIQLTYIHIHIHIYIYIYIQKI